jgi:hypothetical protein
MGLIRTRIPGGGALRDRVKVYRLSHIEPGEEEGDPPIHHHNPDGSLKRTVRYLHTVDGLYNPVPQFEESRPERGGQIVLEPGGGFMLDLQDWPEDIRKPMQDDLLEPEDGSIWRITLSMYSEVFAIVRTVREE